MIKLRMHSALLILVALWSVTLIGINSVPLEKHGVFVLQSAREMQGSGDWILPHFNGEPRLNKPPLSYWATMLVSKLDPYHADIQIWHGRLVSLLAALVMGIATLRAGTLYYGRETGLLAGVFLAGSGLVVKISHNSRPDMLYASFCVLLLFAWMEAWRADDGSGRQRWSSLLGWAAAGLATLTKGPQVPAVFLCGMLVFLLAGKERNRTLHILRPLGGLILYCAIVLPWWILLNHRLQAQGIHIEETQISGSLLRNLADWKELLSGYYLWRLPLTMLPVSLLVPFILPRLWKTRIKKSDATRLMLTIASTWLVIFTLGGHYRSHYLLPILPIASIFLARTLFVFPLSASGKWIVFLFFFTTAGVLGCAGFLLYQGAYPTFFLLSIAGFLLFTLVRTELDSSAWQVHPLASQVLALGILATVFIAGGNALLPLHNRRTEAESFSRRIQGSLKPNDSLVQWSSHTEVLVYYRKRPVPIFKDPAKLNGFIKANTQEGSVFAVVPTRELEHFSQLFEIQLLDDTPTIRKLSRQLTFVKILDTASQNAALL